MTVFKAGDRVRTSSGKDCESGRAHGGTVYSVAAVESPNWLKLSNGSRHPADEFELVEPAEVEQATAILDASDNGWWDFEGADSVYNTNGDAFDVKQATLLGLEVRVQVRRKP